LYRTRESAFHFFTTGLTRAPVNTTLEGSERAARMNPVVLSLICGVGFGALAVALMLPMSFPNKRTALLAAFASRFAIGFLIPLVALPIAGIVKGALVGLLISIPDAIVTKAYVPILVVGGVGGAIIGFIASNAAM
jgi:hypothetical protein